MNTLTDKEKVNIKYSRRPKSRAVSWARWTVSTAPCWHKSETPRSLPLAKSLTTRARATIALDSDQRAACAAAPTTTSSGPKNSGRRPPANSHMNSIGLRPTSGQETIALVSTLSIVKRTLLWGQLYRSLWKTKKWMSALIRTAKTTALSTKWSTTRWLQTTIQRFRR